MTAASTPAPFASLADAGAAVAWLRARMPANGTLRTDSREVCAGDAFLAWPGQAHDGRRFVPAALADGAAACLVEAEGAQAFDLGTSVAAGRIATLAGLKAACGAIADAWFGHPGRKLQVVAVTGTNGKTSTAWWTATALRTLGQRAGVIGTLGVGEPPDVVATGLTTPDGVTLHATLRQLADAGCSACAIEASSIGLVEERLSALKVDVAVFTNFTRDHLDYHGSMEAYWAAKRRLFDWPGLRAAVVNVDDAQGAALAAELRARGTLDLWTVSTRGPARLVAKQLHYERRGLAFEVVESAADGGDGTANGTRATAAAAAVATATLASTLVGDYNASNLLGVLGALRALGHPLAEAARALEKVAAVPGRLQRIAGREVEVVVDYAHTPDALEKVLGALRPLAAARGGRLVCVFGCGGDRDVTKRALMGGIAERGADHVVVTSDNPRGEVPRAILDHIRAGMSAAAARRTDFIEDRREAIGHAVRGAAAGDVVLLAGKGHEDYQEIAGVRRPFSDLDEARAALVRRDAGSVAMPTPRPEGAAA
jgi:MurE/MurF fusion protein